MASPTITPVGADAPTTILPILISQGVLTSGQVSGLPSGADNASIELYLQLNHLASEEQLLKAYAQLYGIPFLHLKNRKITPEIITVIPELTARRYDIVAYDKEGDVLMVALSSPRRFQGGGSKSPGMGLLQQLQHDTKLRIAPALAPLDEIRSMFVNYEGTHPSATVATPGPAAPAAAPTGGFSLVGTLINPTVLRRIPLEAAQHYQFVAYEEPEPNHLLVATLDPTSKATLQIVDYLQKNNGIKITLQKADQASLTAALKQYADVMAGKTPTIEPAASAPAPAGGSQSVLGAAREAVKSVGGQVVKKVQEITADQLITSSGSQDLNASIAASAPPGSIAAISASAHKASPVTPSATGGTALEADVATSEQLIEVVRSGNVPKMVAGIVSLAIALRASDVHVEPEKEKIRLRYRIDGELEDVLLMPHLLHAPLVSRIKILSQLKIDENRVPQDGRFGVSFKDREIDLRVSTLPTIYGEKVVIRILDKTTGIMSLEDMGIDGQNLERLIANIEKPYGIVLSTGPTGSGKSTTLYAALQRISQPEVNVVTLEDPVEYEMVGINQVQIRPKIGFTFAEGLRSILRQDPNIIMVGEIRDKETAEMATHAALTGHLVISTLHTNTAAGALPRLINMGIEPFLITSSINAVVGQRLVRKICENCKIEEKLPEGVIEELKKDLANAPIDEKLKDPASWKFYRGQECPQCHHGYRGRIGIFEVMVMSEQIEALAVKKEPASVIEGQALKEGMMTMKQDGILKAIKGLTTVEEVMKAATE
jgi:type II secretory ATPase GspE/PulE/Tfp pilus assembly ATPase PilB-like protein